MKTLFIFLFALLLVAWGVHGVATDHLYLPLKGNRSLVLQGTPAMVMCLGFVAFAIGLCLYGIGQSGDADRSGRYKAIRWAMLVLGGILTAVAKMM